MTAAGTNRLPVLAAEIRKAHADVQDAAKTATQRAIEAGHALIEAKSLVKHGEWLSWLKSNVDLSARTAQAYMRLAESQAEPNTQRVAHLPVREALRAIADHRLPDGIPPKGTAIDDLWEWADRQCKAPLNDFDLVNLDCLRNKVLSQHGIPDIPAFLFGVKTDVPLLALVSSADLTKTLECLGPIAEGSTTSLDIDYRGLSALQVSQMLAIIQIEAGRLCGKVLRECERRLAIQDEPEYRENIQREQAEAITRWMADCNAQRIRLLGKADYTACDAEAAS
jgi:Protein of unknown function (DUF3102)